MALSYKIMSTVKPNEGDKEKKIWFPKLTGSSQKTLREVADILAERSSASPGDVYMVVVGLVDLIPELLTYGYTVKLDRFGTFRLHAKVETSESPDDVTVRNIKELRVSFRPDNEMKIKVQGAKITKTK